MTTTRTPPAQRIRLSKSTPGERKRIKTVECSVRGELTAAKAGR